MEFIVSQNCNTKLQIWNFPSGSLYHTINHNSVIWSFDVSDDSKVIVFNDYYGNIYLYSLLSKKIFKKIKTPFILIQVKITSKIDRILSVFNKMNILNISLYPKFEYKKSQKHNAIITEYDINEEKKIYVTSSLDNKIIISNLKTNETIKELNNFQPYVTRIIFNDTKFYTVSLDDEIKEWCLNKLKFIKYLYIDLNSILDLKFKNKNTIIYSNNNQEIIQKNLENNETKILNVRLYPEQLEFCKNNKIIYLDNNGNIYYQSKKIIDSDIIKFKHLEFKTNNLNIFDQILYDIINYILQLNNLKYLVIKKINEKLNF
jgi:WD40 repeat protein